MTPLLPDLLTELAADFRWLRRQFGLDGSPEQALRLRRLLDTWDERLAALDRKSTRLNSSHT